MKKAMWMMTTALVLSGCATSRQAYLPDGSKGHAIDCSGSAGTWGMCEEKAGQLCKERGYEVISRSGDQGAVVSGSNMGLFGGTVTSRSMLIKCK